MQVKFLLPLVISVFIIVILSIVSFKQRDAQDVGILKNYNLQVVPEFIMPTIGTYRKHSDVVDQSIFAEKISVISVWSVSCMACLHEHEFIKNLAHDEMYNFVGINYKNDRETADQWLHTYGDPYRFSISDSEGLLSLRLGVRGLPMTMLVDKTGKVIVKHVGVLTNEIWEQKFAL